MQIGYHPGIQRDPKWRANVIRIAVYIYRPTWTGQPCNWAIVLGTPKDRAHLHLGDYDHDPHFASCWESDKLLELIDCGFIQKSHHGRALELMKRCAMNVINRRNSHFWVFSSFAQLSICCGMVLTPGVDEVLRGKQNERPEGFMSQLVPTSP